VEEKRRKLVHDRERKTLSFSLNHEIDSLFSHAIKSLLSFNLNHIRNHFTLLPIANESNQYLNQGLRRKFKGKERKKSIRNKSVIPLFDQLIPDLELKGFLFLVHLSFEHSSFRCRNRMQTQTIKNKEMG